MGRFAFTVEFYTRYREPYSEQFFRTVAERLGLKGNEALLDVGCGPGPLAIGFAPFVASCTGLDPEPAMIEAARAAAAQTGGARLTFQLGRIEDIKSEDIKAGASFSIVTIGRALHWLERPAALEVLEKIVSASGRILVCRPTSVETPATPWLKLYEEICRTWSDDPERKRYRLEAKDWFAGSRFCEGDSISVTETRSVRIEDLIGRALSKSNTSTAKIGNRLGEFTAQIREALTPFLQRGVLKEEIVSTAEVFESPA
jgi:SAM-dependent methyltransferase